MEVGAASCRTVIARVFEFCFICGYFLFVDKKIAYRLKHITMKCRDLVGDYLRSASGAGQRHFAGLGQQRCCHGYGTHWATFVSASAITTVTQQLSTVFIQGISNASSIITGHTLGQGDYDRAQRQGFTFLGLGTVIGVLAGVFIMAISGPVIFLRWRTEHYDN